MRTIRLGDIAVVDLSNVDKKTKPGEREVRLCNFVDVYKNWAITESVATNFMVASANNNQISRFAIKAGQVAITKDSETRDDIGIPTFIADDIKDCVLGYHCALITPDETKLDGAYLNSMLHTKYALKYFGDHASGSGQRYTLTKEIIEDFPVILPDTIEEQKALALVLTNINRKITLNDSICTDLEAMTKLLYDYWFVQFDFPDRNGNPYKSSGGKMVYNEELNREIPEGWEVVPFSNCISSINSGLNPRDNFVLNTGGKIRYLTVKNLNNDGSLDFSTVDMIDEKARTLVHKRSNIAVGDILFASISPLGRCHLILSDPVDWDINESVFSIRPNFEVMTSIYLYMTFMSESFIKKAESGSVGSIFKGIRITELSEMKTVRPSKTILDKFDEVTKKIFIKKNNLFIENQQLAELRDFLLPMLMNGQIEIGM